MTFRAFSAAVLLSLIPATAAVAQTNNNNANDNRGNERAAARTAAVAAARAEVTAAVSRMRAAEQRVRANWQAAPEMLAAEKELEVAQAEFDRTSKPILGRLQDDPNYKQAKAEEDEAARKVTAEHAKSVAADPASTQPTTLPTVADPSDNKSAQQQEMDLNIPVPSDHQVVAAVDKLHTRTKLRELEDAALANDPTAMAARAKVDAASEKLKALRLQLQAALLNDADYKAALEQATAARGRVSAAASGNY